MYKNIAERMFAGTTVHPAALFMNSNKAVDMGTPFKRVVKGM